MKFFLESMSTNSYRVKEVFNKYQCNDITEWDFIDYFHEMGWVIDGDVILIIDGLQVVRTCNIIVCYDEVVNFLKSKGYCECKYRKKLGFAFGRIPDGDNQKGYDVDFKKWVGIIECEVDDQGLFFKIIRRKNNDNHKVIFRKVD